MTHNTQAPSTAPYPIGESPTRRVEHAANWPTIDVDTQLALARDEFSTVQAALAANPCLCSEAEMILLGSTDRDVRRALVSNPSLSRTGQLTLAQDEYDWILRDSLAGRGRAASQPPIDPELACVLSHDPDWRVRLSLSENPSLVPSDDMAAAFFSEHLVFEEFFKEYFSDCDAAAVETLAEDWTGTLSELRHVMISLGPDTAH